MVLGNREREQVALRDICEIKLMEFGEQLGMMVIEEERIPGALSIWGLHGWVLISDLGVQVRGRIVCNDPEFELALIWTCCH